MLIEVICTEGGNKSVMGDCDAEVSQENDFISCVACVYVHVSFEALLHTAWSFQVQLGEEFDIKNFVMINTGTTTP